MTNRFKAIAVLLAASLASAASLGAAAGDEGVFSEEQAKAGELAYASQCAACHGAKLLGPNAPALIGSDVMQTFDTVAGLYNYIAVAMPPQAPGRLDEDQYLEIVAFILKENGARAGTVPLRLDQARMRQLSLAAITHPKAGIKPDDTAPSATPQDEVPQAYTWGKKLPSVN